MAIIYEPKGPALEYSKELELKIDWGKFLRDVRKLLKGKQYYIKTDLLAWDR